ncbi:hypothetical protein Ancab_014186 [Ancistrocladus abbreviatus]
MKAREADTFDLQQDNQGATCNEIGNKIANYVVAHKLPKVKWTKLSGAFGSKVGHHDVAYLMDKYDQACSS